MHRGNMFNGYGNMFWLTWLIPLILLALIVFAAYMIFKNNENSEKISRDGNSQSSSRALEILDERYAKGEIDEDEYKHRKSVLKN